MLLLEGRVLVGHCFEMMLKRLTEEGKVESDGHKRHSYSCLKLQLLLLLLLSHFSHVRLCATP